MHDGYPNVVEDDWEPQRLLLDRRRGSGKFVRECLAESGPPRSQELGIGD